MKNILAIAVIGLTLAACGTKDESSKINAADVKQDSNAKPATLLPVDICTADINEFGNPSACNCPADYKYDSKSGKCHLDSLPVVLGTASNMEIISTRFGFEKVQSVHMTLSSDASDRKATAIQVEMNFLNAEEEMENRKVILEVTDIEVDSCGSKMIFARLPQVQVGEGEVDPINVQGRFSVALTDNTERQCMDRQPNWEAEIREGYGWCGTMDATMRVAGIPYFTK